jgi:hypothetical protein
MMGMEQAMRTADQGVAASEAAAGAAGEQRSDTRQRTLFAVGKLTVAGCEHVCTVRNISDGGVGIDLALPLPVGTPVTIELRGLPPTAAQVRWVRDGRIGLAFEARVAVDLFRATPGRTLRSPRFAFGRAVTLAVDGSEVAATAVDLALGGMKLADVPGVPIGTPVVVAVVGGTLALRGRICWQASGALGVRFSTPLTAGQLAEILRA